jgi:uncharacterized protein with FMN-binding domain
MEPKKGKKKMSGWIILLAVLTILGSAGMYGWSLLEKEHKEARSLPLNRVDFTRLKDGMYTGEYEGGMYKWRTTSVRVTVDGGKLDQIDLIASKEDRGEGWSRTLYDRAIESQSLQVDTISGATLTSKAYLQAAENALIQANQE